VRRFASLSPLGPRELGFLRDLTASAETAPPGTVLVDEGEVITRPRLVLSGWVGRQRLLPDGRRQILGFLLTGDLLGLERQLRPLSSVRTVALTAVRLADATSLKSLLARPEAVLQPLSDACAASLALEEALLLDHVVRLGRQTAYERVAHLLLEFRDRLAAAGLVTGDRYALPLTQETLADALGLSMVHVNRTLQQLRRERLIELRAGVVRLLDPERLAAAADYRPPSPSIWRV
jgi:CRP-like cAMP-binding protein